MALIVHATLVVQPDHREAFLAGAAQLVAASNAEEGVLEYGMFESAAAPNTFLMVERYADEAAFGAHMTSPHFTAAAPTLMQVLAAPPQIVKYVSDDGEVVSLG